MSRPASLPPQKEHDRFHVVLVEPGDSLNVGSVARAMMNLGFHHLHLVSPPRYDPEKAAVTACWAVNILKNAKFHDSINEALSPMQRVVGFTARHGKNRPRHLMLPEWNNLLAKEPPVRTALLFGSEDVGLRREHLTHCHWLVRIPSSGDNPSYNLGQAVLLVLFELSRSGFDQTELPRREPAQTGDLYQLELIVEEVLTRVRFYKKGTPVPVPDTVKHLLRRIDPDEREMSILLGIFGKINRALQGKVPVAPYPKEEEGE